MKNNDFLIGKPRIYPEKLINELKKLFSRLRNVRSAYIAQIFVPSSQIPVHPIIGIDMIGELNDIAAELETVINNTIGQDEYIDVFPSNAKGLAEYFATIEPFYKSSDK